MFERFNCSVALRSPAHITLISPFWMKPELEAELQISIDTFTRSPHDFEIELQNFSFFKPRVVFINVNESNNLIQLQQELFSWLMNTNGFRIKKDERPFHPHMTIATRDLRKKIFYEAWEIFRDKRYYAEWNVSGVSLLRHNNKNWDVIYTSQFNN